MYASLSAVALRVLAARGGRDNGGTRAPRMGWLHDWFANDPWIAWPVAVLVGVLLVFVLIGRLIFKTIGDVPWWARLGLLGAVFLWWRKRRQPDAGSVPVDPAQWIDLRDYRTRE